jgi:hypothetical protein
MYQLDPRLRGIPANRDQLVAVFQSINSPHLAIPGKQAGPAQGYVVGLRGAQGFAAFVYLYLPEPQDCAVYVPDRSVTSEEYKEAESEALGFVESMGFMMDNMNFRSLGVEAQAELMRTLPVFLKDPKLAVRPVTEKAGDGKPTPAVLLGRLFSSF